MVTLKHSKSKKTPRCRCRHGAQQYVTSKRQTSCSVLDTIWNH